MADIKISQLPAATTITGLYTLATDDENKSVKVSMDILRGATGAPGQDATITVGTTTTGEAGTEASVTNSGTSGAAVLNFVIPRGATGPEGPAGNLNTKLDGYVVPSTPTPVTADSTVLEAFENIGSQLVWKADLDIPTGYVKDSQISPLQGLVTGVNTSTGYLSSTASQFLTTASKSVAVTFRTGAALGSTNEFIFTQGNANVGMRLVLLNGKILQAYYGQNGFTFTGVNIAADTVYNVAVTYDQSTNELKGYVNGSLTNTFTVTNPGSAPEYFAVGSRGGTSNFTHSINSVQVFNYVLTAEQVSTLWNNGQPWAYVVPAADKGEGDSKCIAEYVAGGLTAASWRDSSGNKLDMQSEGTPVLSYETFQVSGGGSSDDAVLTHVGTSTTYRNINNAADSLEVYFDDGEQGWNATIKMTADAIEFSDSGENKTEITTNDIKINGISINPYKPNILDNNNQTVDGLVGGQTKVDGTNKGAFVLFHNQTDYGPCRASLGMQRTNASGALIGAPWNITAYRSLTVLPDILEAGDVYQGTITANKTITLGSWDASLGDNGWYPGAVSRLFVYGKFTIDFQNTGSDYSDVYLAPDWNDNNPTTMADGSICVYTVTYSGIQWMVERKICKPASA